MKKRLITLLLAVLFTACLFCSVGCSSKAALSFKGNFAGEETLRPDYKEVLTYKVSTNLKNPTYAQDAQIKNKKMTYDINGSYVSTLSVMERNEMADVFSKTDIKAADTENIYRLETLLTLNTTYTFDTKEPFTHVDTISNVIYFLSTESSFQPLFSKSVAEYTGLVLTSTPACAIIKYDMEIVYKSTSYTKSVRQIDYVSTEPADLPEKPTTQTIEYTKRTVIDNSQLIFALRNTSLSLDSTMVIPVVSLSYDQPTDLLIKNGNDTAEMEFTESNAVNFNGTPVTGKMKVKILSYAVNNTNTSGAAQYVYIQKSSLGEIKNKALPVKMVAPIVPTYGSFACLGALEYDLVSVSIS